MKPALLTVLLLLLFSLAACQSAWPPRLRSGPTTDGPESLQAQSDAPSSTQIGMTSQDANRLPAVPHYEVVESLPMGDSDRTRYRTHLLVPPTLSREELIAVLVDAVRTTLREQPIAQAVVILAFDRPAHVGRVYNTGRALASRDRQGWRGDDSFAPFLRIADTGSIYITLGSALTGIEHIEVRQ